MLFLVKDHYFTFFAANALLLIGDEAKSADR